MVPVALFKHIPGVSTMGIGNRAYQGEKKDRIPYLCVKDFWMREVAFFSKGHSLLIQYYRYQP